MGHLHAEDPGPEPLPALDPDPVADDSFGDVLVDDVDRTRNVLPLEALTTEPAKVLELGAGTARLSRYVEQQGLKTVPVERAGGSYFAEHPILYVDMRDEDVQETIMDSIAAGQVAHVHMSGPGPSLDRPEAEKRKRM